jgi:hemerythrin-like metal-binding protein
MMRQDERFANALKRFRRWLLEEQTTITNWTEIGSGPLVLPDNMRVGQKVIDRDHETLFVMANDIRDMLRQGDPRHVVEMAERLLIEMLAHFDREESILESAGHSHASAHAKYHSLLRQRVPRIRGVLADLAKGGEASRATFDILIAFLLNDPIAADMDLRPFFANNPQAVG